MRIILRLAIVTTKAMQPRRTPRSRICSPFGQGDLRRSSPKRRSMNRPNIEALPSVADMGFNFSPQDGIYRRRIYFLLLCIYWYIYSRTSTCIYVQPIDIDMPLFIIIIGRGKCGKRQPPNSVNG